MRANGEGVAAPGVRLEPCDVLIVIAHPDDEVFASATLCLCAERGLKIALVAVTDGEGGDTHILHPGQDRARLAEVRRREVTLSAWALGVHQVAFLGFPDVPTDAWSSDGWDCTAALADVLEQCTPKLVLAHGPRGGYGHPAHCQVGVAIVAAAERVGFTGSVFSFAGKLPGAFYSWRFDQPSDVRIDGRPFLARRMSSLSYHQSEIQFFLSPYAPRTLRNHLSAAFGMMFPFLEAGRKRKTVGATKTFFRRFPFEGLVLQRPPPGGGRHFFAERFAGDPRVRLLS